MHPIGCAAVPVSPCHGAAPNQARTADLFDDIEVFYNRSRRHFTPGHKSPVRFLQDSLDWIKTQHEQKMAA